MTQHPWYLQGWFLAVVTAAVWAGAYAWYVMLGTQPLSDLWVVPLRRRNARIAAAREAVRTVQADVNPPPPTGVAASGRGRE